MFSAQETTPAAFLYVGARRAKLEGGTILFSVERPVSLRNFFRLLGVSSGPDFSRPRTHVPRAIKQSE